MRENVDKTIATQDEEKEEGTDSNTRGRDKIYRRLQQHNKEEKAGDRDR